MDTDKCSGRCSGECLTAADIGIAEWGGMIAYPHPMCPEHGSPEAFVDHEIAVTCWRCKQPHTILVKEEDHQRWLAGESVQKVFHYLSADDRELILTSTCGPCFDSMCPEEDD